MNRNEKTNDNRWRNGLRRRNKQFCQYSGKHTFLSTNTVKAQALCTSDHFSFFICDESSRIIWCIDIEYPDCISRIYPSSERMFFRWCSWRIDRWEYQLINDSHTRARPHTHNVNLDHKIWTKELSTARTFFLFFLFVYLLFKKFSEKLFANILEATIVARWWYSRRSEQSFRNIGVFQPNRK